MHDVKERIDRLLIRAVVATIAAFAVLAVGEGSRVLADPTPPPSPAAATMPGSSFTADIAAASDMQRQGRSREAIALLEADHKQDPSNRDVIVALARTYSFAGQRGRAIALLDELLKTDPSDVDARIILGQAYAFNHDYPAAEAQYGTALAAVPTDEDAAVGLAQTYTFEGRFSDAKTLYQKILARDPKNYDARVGLAGVEGFTGDYSRAKADYETVLGVQPNNVDALIGLATVSFWTVNVSAAIALDNRALAIDPGDSDARDLKKMLTMRTAPQIIASLVSTHSNDGSTFDYQLAERYYANPTTSVGLVQELYQIGNGKIAVQTHRLGIVATYQGPNQFGANLRIVGSKFGGLAAVTDGDLSVSGARKGLAYGLGMSVGGVDGSIAANGGQSAFGETSAIVRIATLYGNVGYTRRANSIQITTQSASYNDGNRFHELTVDVSHQIGIGAYTSVTPGISWRTAGFADSTYQQSFLPGYYNFEAQRDLNVNVTAQRELSDRFSAGIIAALGGRHTRIPLLYLPLDFSSGTMPYQKFEPYFDYEGDRFSLTAAIYDDHYAGDLPYIQPYAATTIDVNFTIRLP